jgi:hypothetical protein
VLRDVTVGIEPGEVAAIRAVWGRNFNEVVRIMAAPGPDLAASRYLA